MSQLVTHNQRTRGLKKFFGGKPVLYRGICHKNFEESSRAELNNLYPKLKVEKGTGYVEFEASYKSYDHLSKSLSTVDRLYITLAEFYASSLPEFYNKVKRLPIKFFLTDERAVRLNIVSKKCRLHHTQNLKNIMQEAWELKTLSYDSSIESTVIVAGFKDRFVVRLEWNGFPLYRRYYRCNLGIAPFRPTAAALLLKLVDFQSYPVVCDPFCGTGVFLLEAARIGFGKMLHRETKLASWGLSSPEKPFNKMEKPVLLVGSDVSKDQLKAALQNKKEGGAWAENVQLELKSFGKNFQAPVKNGLVISNLPFGERINFEGLSDLYDVTSLMSGIFAGWSFCLVSAEKLPNIKHLRKDYERLLFSGGKKRFVTTGKFLDNQDVV